MVKYIILWNRRTHKKGVHIKIDDPQGMVKLQTHQFMAVNGNIHHYQDNANWVR